MELKNFNDCGTLIYDLEGQDVHCGGSGCGCSAVVLAGCKEYYYPDVPEEYRDYFPYKTGDSIVFVNGD